jgi:hypothetical protein
MNQSEFEKYLAYFNSRNYEKAMAFFIDDMMLKFAGYEISGKKDFIEFYRFFHHYVDEQVIVRQFAGDDENVIIDVIVRLEGREPLSSDMLKEKGFGRLAVPAQGEVVEIPQFIHYRIENGKFAEIRCVIK